MPCRLPRPWSLLAALVLFAPAARAASFPPDGVWGPATEAAIVAALPGEEVEPESPVAPSRAGLWIGVGVGVGLAAGVAWFAQRKSA